MFPRRLFLPVLLLFTASCAQENGPEVDPFDVIFRAATRPDKLPDVLPPPAKTAVKQEIKPDTKAILPYVQLSASLNESQAKRGQVVTVRIKGKTPAYSYTYSAVKRLDGQAGPLTRINYTQAPWIKPLFPVKESNAEVYSSSSGDSLILHHDFQWEQELYVSPEAPIGTQKFNVVVRLQVCTKNDPIAGTGESCFVATNYLPLEVSLNVLEGAAPSAPSDLQSRLLDPNKTAEIRPPSTPGAGGVPMELAPLLIGAVLGAILMLLTPCVFPMIPITVNFFIKQSEKEHHRPFLMASVYAGTIVVLLTAVVLLVGGSIIKLANNPWFNLSLGVVLVVFALGLFGMFEVDLTKFFGTVLILGIAYGLSVVGKMVFPVLGGSEFLLAVLSIGVAFPVTFLLAHGVRAVEAMLGFEESAIMSFLVHQEGRGGSLGAIFMALTFTITSFSCMGPFLALLLAPLAGTSLPRLHLLLAALVYSMTFAAPFFVLALFPTYLKKLPKSGGWMTTIKVTMGFIEVGAALKFLANTDLFWFPGNPRIFNYDTVLCSWIALSVACSLYLFGLFRLDHDTPSEHIGVPRMIFASLFMGMAFYLTPLLFGITPSGFVMEGAVSFLPLDLNERSEIAWVKDDYERGWKQAVKENKLIFIDFTGVNCANCRENERNVFRKPAVIQELKQYVCVQLHTDLVPDDSLTPSEAEAHAEKQHMYRFGLLKKLTNPTYVILEPDPKQAFDGDNIKGRVVDYREGKIFNRSDFLKFLREPGKKKT